MGNLSLLGAFSSLGELWSPNQASSPLQGGDEPLAAVSQPSLTTSQHPHCHSQEQRDQALVLVTPSLALQSLRSAGLASCSVTNVQDQLLTLSLRKFQISAKNSPHINSLLQDPGSRVCSTAHCGVVINIYLTEEQSLPKERLLTSARTIFPSGGETASLFLKGDISPHKKFLPHSWHHSRQDPSPHPWGHSSTPSHQAPSFQPPGLVATGPYHLGASPGRHFPSH